MNLAVIIPAAGFSKRFKDASADGRSKLDQDMGGRPVLQRTIELFTKHPDVQTIIVAGPNDESAMAEFKLRHGDKLGLLGVTLVAGGKKHRYETIKAALGAVPDDATHIAVHDAARPCTPPELIDRLIDAAGKFDAVVPAIEVTDTLKRASEPEEAPVEADPFAAILGPSGGAKVRTVLETVDRSAMVAVQTPQIFKAELLRRAYEQDDLSSTDDAQLVERLGEPVTVIDGDIRNIKITLPSDMPVARSLAGVKSPQGRPAHRRF